MSTTEAPSPADRGSESNDLLGLAPERAAFEAWFSEGGKWPAAVRRSGDGYRLAAAHSAWNAYKAAWDCQQAKIDRLMLEWCPDEMTAEQLANWAAHQRPISDADHEAVAAALKA